MAGIGFRLTKYFTEKDFYKNLKGSIYSIIISSGPWLLSVISIAVLGVFAKRGLGNQDLFVFKCIISYSFSFSLILFGLVELPLTRYLADRLFISDQSSFRNVYLMIGAGFVVIGGLAAFGFYSFFDWGIDLVLLCVALLVSILLTWHSMIFLSAAKHFHQIVMSFVLGMLSSIVFGLVLGHFFGLIGYVGGFTFGQIIQVVLLARNLFKEFPSYDLLVFEVFDYFFRFRSMMAIGFLYYLGIWMDKFLFWFSDVGTHVEGLFYTSQNYDTSIFLSYLSIVPSLAVFLVNVETNFYIKYSYFFRSIQKKNDLKFLESAGLDIVESFQNTFSSLIRLQAFISIILWFFASNILSALALPQVLTPIFRYGLIGSFFQVLFLVLNIALLYFKEVRSVLINYLCFFLTNTLFTYLTLKFTPELKYYGFGYMLSSIVTFFLSFYFLNITFKNLNYITFMRQPIRHNIEPEMI